MKMQVISFIGLITLTFASHSSFAASSGQCSLSTGAIASIEQSFARHMKALDVHAENLLGQADTAMRRRTDSGMTDAEKVMREQDLVNSAANSAQRLAAQLDKVSVIAMIRDSVRDKTDKEIVERFLSIESKGTYQIAVNVRRYISKLLDRFTVPSVAIDVGKLRDNLDDVIQKMGGCN